MLEGGGWRSIALRGYDFDQSWEPEISNGSKTYSQFEYSSRVSPSQPRRIGFPLGTFSTQVELRGEWWSTEPAKNIQLLWRPFIKKNETCPNQIRRVKHQTSLDPLPLNLWREFSPFLIEKVLSTRTTLKNLKKIRNGNLLVEVKGRG